jgi:hypothetical protein
MDKCYTWPKNVVFGRWCLSALTAFNHMGGVIISIIIIAIKTVNGGFIRRQWYYNKTQHTTHHTQNTAHKTTKLKTKLHDFSPQANYSDWAIAACRRR